MATRPVVADLAAWVNIPVPNDTTVLEESLDAALDLIESRINLPDGADGDAYPQSVRTGVLMQANRIYKRRTSPEGVAGFGADGSIRISGVDVDVEQLISRFLKLDGFA